MKTHKSSTRPIKSRNICGKLGVFLRAIRWQGVSPAFPPHRWAHHLLIWYIKRFYVRVLAQFNANRHHNTLLALVKALKLHSYYWRYLRDWKVWWKKWGAAHFKERKLVVSNFQFYCVGWCNQKGNFLIYTWLFWSHSLNKYWTYFFSIQFGFVSASNSVNLSQAWNYRHINKQDLNFIIALTLMCSSTQAIQAIDPSIFTN